MYKRLIVMAALLCSSTMSTAASPNPDFLEKAGLAYVRGLCNGVLQAQQELGTAPRKPAGADYTEATRNQCAYIFEMTDKPTCVAKKNCLTYAQWTKASKPGKKVKSRPTSAAKPAAVADQASNRHDDLGR